MDYASSYATGMSPLGHDAARQPVLHAASEVLPAPRPQRMHWSTLVFTGGMCVCLVALLATIAGVPGRLGYDVDGAPNRNKPSSNDPMALSKSLDGNMKWIDVSSSDGKGGYVNYIQSINRSEAAIPAMVQALVAMDASVKSLDSGLASMGEVTATMNDDMAAMADVSARSGETMDALAGDIGFLSSSMLGLAESTQQLTTRMGTIEKMAGGIAANGTTEALKNTQHLNRTLPDDVPMPTTSEGVPLDQAMARLASGGGTDGAVEGEAVAQ